MAKYKAAHARHNWFTTNEGAKNLHTKLKNWARYNGKLNTKLTPHDNLYTEIPERIELLAKFYVIDTSTQHWERELLLVLAHRHVPGFQFRHFKSRKVDNISWIEIVDRKRDEFEMSTGVRPSAAKTIDALASTKEWRDSPDTMTVSRLKRIYSGKTEHERKADREYRMRHAARLHPESTATNPVPSLPKDDWACIYANILRSRKSAN